VWHVGNLTSVGRGIGSKRCNDLVECLNENCFYLFVCFVADFLIHFGYVRIVVV